MREHAPPLAAVLAAAALLSAACGGTSTEPGPTGTQGQSSGPSATGDQRLYGTIDSLERDGDHYLLRFDPSWFLTGVTANVAQAEDEHVPCEPAACPPVANDNYRVDEGDRVLTFLVPADVSGTVLVRTDQGFGEQEVTVGELAGLVAGTSSLELFEPLSTGVWILVHVDTVRAFAHQYLP